jgi:hypothetical protein
MNKRYQRLFLILCFFSSLLMAGQVTSVSPYSRLGLGQPLPVTFTRSLGMGSASMALTNPLNVDISNPASYANLELTTFEAGMEFTFLQQQQANPAFNVSNNTSGFRYFTFGVPLTNWWGSVGGLKPYSFKGYNINTQRRLRADTTQVVNDNFTGEGGLNRVFWGNSFKVAEGFTLGFNLSYLFGRLADNALVDFENPTFLDTRSQLETNVSGVFLEYGAQYTYNLSNQKFIASGLSLANASNLSAQYRQYQFTVNGNLSLDTLRGGINSNSQITLPNELKVGLSYGQNHPNILNPAWAVNFDYETYQGSQFRNANGSAPLADGSSLQLGGFVTPRYAFSKLERNQNYFLSVEYRLGAYFQNMPLVVDGTQITDYGITFGLGLPIKQKSVAPGEVKISTLNIGARLGRRGTLSNNLIQEDYLNIFIGITLNDKWFIDYKYR